TAGRWSFALMFIGFNLAFFLMQLAGLGGMPRRIFTYPTEMGWDSVNLWITIGALLLALGVLVSLVNFWVSAHRGEQAGPNPWQADTLEWATSSPPPPYGTA